MPRKAEKTLKQILDSAYENGSTTENAKKIATMLRDTQKHVFDNAIPSPVSNELSEFDGAVIGYAIELLRILETEQWRQREAIKHYLHGQMTRIELAKIADTWNGERA